MARKSIIQIMIVSAILIVAISWFIIENAGSTEGIPIKMIPSNSAMVIEIDNPKDILDKLKNDNQIWNKLIKVNEIASIENNLVWLDTLFLEHLDYLNKLEKNSLTIAIFSDTLNSFGSVIYSQIRSNPDIDLLKRRLGDRLGRDFGVLDIPGVSKGLKIINLINESSAYIAIIDGVFVFTTSFELLNITLNTHNGIQESLFTNTSFVKLKEVGGTKVHARLFFQYNEMCELLKTTINSAEFEVLNWVSKFADWTEVDVLIKNNELIFSGYTISNGDDNYLNSFNGQDDVKTNVINLLPFNINTMLWIGVSDFQTYFYNNKTEVEANEIAKGINYDINKLLKLFGSEIAFASNAEQKQTAINSSWVVVKVNNSETAKTALHRISRNVGKGTTSKHEKYTIGRISKSDFISQIFGQAFSSVTQNYYTFIGDYVIFANSKNSLINLIGYFETGKTLDLNDNFKRFSDNISTKSNILIYLKPSGIIGKLNQYFNDQSSRVINYNSQVVSSFQGLSFQLTHGDEFSFTNIYTSFATGYHEENLALWKASLSDEIVCGPFIVKDHQTKNQNVIVFDKMNKMYFIDSEGSVKWKRNIDAKPVSNVYEIDFYKNRKWQYLFNTGNYIYLIDRKGNDVTGFPKKLHSKATNGIVVFDYLNNKDYRLLVAQSDKKVYNYTVNGKEVQGWSKPKMQNIVVAPISRLLANKKDYIIITDIENEIKIVDRKGKRRIKVPSNLKKAKNSNYYVNRTNSKGIIITSDQTGKLVYISSSGKLNFTDFGKFSANHFFLYEDFNGDRSKDFIFIDENRLKVFDRFKKELFSYEFNSDISIKPSFFDLGNKQNVLGVVADKEKTIYLFDKQGNIIISKGLVGETQFTVGNLQNNNKINLISAAGNTLYNYRLR